MPYNPGVVDRSGEIYANGLLSAANNLSGAFTNAASRYQNEVDENKALTAQSKAIETIFKTDPNMFGLTAQDLDAALSPSPDETPRARNARLNQLLAGAVTKSELASRALNNQQLATVIAGEKQRQGIVGRQQTDALAQSGALRSIFGGTPTVDELNAMLHGGANFTDLTDGGAPPSSAADAVRKSLAAGVEDPRLLAALSKYSESEPFTPAMVDLGNGTVAMMTSPKSAVPIIKPPKTSAATPITVGNRQFTVGPGNRYFDERGAPVQFATDRAPKAPDIMLKHDDPELYDAMRADYLDWTTQQKFKRGGQAPAPIAGKPSTVKATTPVAPSFFKTVAEVTAAYKAGKIDYPTAAQILKEQFNIGNPAADSADE